MILTSLFQSWLGSAVTWENFKTYVHKLMQPTSSASLHQTLRENPHLPCVKMFAACFISGVRQIALLLCVFYRAHGNEKRTAMSLYVVRQTKTHNKLTTKYFSPSYPSK
jgi:hypothetical protein